VKHGNNCYFVDTIPLKLEQSPFLYVETYRLANDLFQVTNGGRLRMLSMSRRRRRRRSRRKRRRRWGRRRSNARFARSFPGANASALFIGERTPIGCATVAGSGWQYRCCHAAFPYSPCSTTTCFDGAVETQHGSMMVLRPSLAFASALHRHECLYRQR
jgi:hypothetical protein